MADKGSLMKLRLTQCKLIFTGENSKGTYTIYEVLACKEDGTVVEQKLRSFVELPVGPLVEVYVSRYESPKHGVSFTLAPKNGAPSQGQDLTHLKDEVETLRGVVDSLQERVGRLERGIHVQSGGEIQPLATTTQPLTQSTGSASSQFGDDPPF